MIVHVPQLAGPRRLDRVLKEELPALSRNGLFAALRKGRVRVDGVRVRDGACLLTGGEEVTVEEEQREADADGQATRPARSRDSGSASASAAADGSPARARRSREMYTILHEDAALLVLDKPARVAVHPGEASGVSLIEVLRDYGRAHGFEPFLVHRLDRNTTGVLVVAKSRETAGLLGRTLKEGRAVGDARSERPAVKKWYLALVFGEPPTAVQITEPLDGDSADSRIHLVGRYRWEEIPIALLEVRILTGRKHQIRRHLSGAGYPIVGDELYGDWEKNRRVRKEWGAKGLFLHSAGIELAHPVTGARMRFEAGLPAEFKRVLESLYSTTPP